MRCTKCNINWARLWSQDSEEENYEYCPECLTDYFLEAGTDPGEFIKCLFSGRITNVKTGEVLVRPSSLPNFKKWKERPAMTATAAALEERDNRALEAYHLSGKKEDFFKEYNNYE